MNNLGVRTTVTLILLVGTLSSVCFQQVHAKRRRRVRPRTRRQDVIGQGIIGSGKCEVIQVPMCKNMVDYTSTMLPNAYGHSTQAQVYWAMQRWWPFLDAGCSDNLRNFVCGLYLPKCVGEKIAPHYPCKETCKKAKSRCKRQMRRQGYRWNTFFKCRNLRSAKSNKCIKPKRETKKGKNREYVLCEVNKLSMCQDIPFTQGSLPNMFLQSDLTTIEREMAQYKELVSSGCSNKLRLFLCGVFMPFCVQGRHHNDNRGSNEDTDSNDSKDSDRERELAHSSIITPQHDVPFLLPCREWCQEVFDSCSGEYQQRTQGLPWPGKFHCHRFPSYHSMFNYHPAHNISDAHSPTIPCTMPPVNYQH